LWLHFWNLERYYFKANQLLLYDLPIAINVTTSKRAVAETLPIQNLFAKLLIFHRQTGCHALYVGLSCYGLVTRFQGLSPFQTTWLLKSKQNNLDGAMGYLGWEFFRRSDFLQWPIGAIPGLGPSRGSSVAMTDSIPLLAFIFKPLTFWFDEPFQYFGIWILVCFCLQAFFAMKLISEQFNYGLSVVVGSVFFVIAPAFIDRMMHNIPLSGHWIVLAAMYLCQLKQFNCFQWFGLAAVSVLVQPYLALIVTIFFIAATLSEVKNTKITAARALSILVLFVLINLAICFQSGLFVFGAENTAASGYGSYGANIISLINPGITFMHKDLFWIWSSRLPYLNQSVYRYEGFSYVGSGIILLATTALLLGLRGLNITNKILRVALLLGLYLMVDNFLNLATLTTISFFALAYVVFRIFSRTTESTYQLNSPTKIGILILWFFSLANIIAIGEQEIVFPLPQMLVSVLNIFRSSGRFVWPLMYAFILVTVGLISRGAGKRISLVLLVSGLLIQVSESRDALHLARMSFSSESIGSPLISPKWVEIGKSFERVVFVPPSGTPNSVATTKSLGSFDGILWRDLGIFALQYNLQMNAFYFSRTPSSYESDAVVIRQMVASGRYSKDSLFVFLDPALWSKAKNFHSEQDLVGTLDGIPIVAPGMRSCNSCLISGFVSTEDGIVDN